MTTILQAYALPHVFQSKFRLLQPSDQLLSPQTWQFFKLNLPIHNSNSLFWFHNSKTVFNLVSSLNLKSSEHWISHGTVSSLSPPHVPPSAVHPDFTQLLKCQKCEFDLFPPAELKQINEPSPKCLETYSCEKKLQEFTRQIPETVRCHMMIYLNLLAQTGLEQCTW